MVKKIAIYCAIALILSMLGAVLLNQKNMRIYPRFCASVYAHENWIYSIDYDSQNKKVRIFRVNESGDELSLISLNAQTKDTVFNYDTLMQDHSDNSIYYHAAEFFTSTGELISETIYHCNFENGTVQAVWRIPVDHIEARNVNYILTYRIKDHALEYLTDTEEGYAVYEMTEDGDMHLLRNVVCADDASMSQFRLDTQGNVCAFSCAAGMYYESEEGVLHPISGEENVWGSYYSPIWREDSISWVDVEAGRQLTYQMAEDKLSSISSPDTYFITVDSNENVYSIKQDMLTTFGAADEGYAVYAELPDAVKKDLERTGKFEHGIGIYRGGRLHLLSALRISPKIALQYIGKTALILMGIALIIGVFWLALFLVQRQTGFISLRLEMAGFAVLLLGLSIFVMAKTLEIAFTVIYNENYSEMRQALQEELNAELDNLIEQDLYFTEDTIYTQQFYEKLDETLGEIRICNPTTSQNTFAPFFLIHILKPDNELEILYNSGEMEHVPTTYMYYNTYLEQEFNDVLKTHQSKKIEQYDTSGTWDVQLSYYENPKYHIRGVIEIGIDAYLTKWRMKKAINQAVQFTLILFGLMTLLLLIYLGSSLSPVKRLGIQITKGRIDPPNTNQHWSTEIKTIWERLYVLINSGMQQKEALERNNHEHYRFFSRELVTLLGKSEMPEISTGTRRQCNLQIVHAVFQKPDPERFTVFSEAMTKMASTKGGILLSMDMHHAVWVFESHYGDPFGTAKEILRLAKDDGITCGIGLGSDNSTIYVRGADWSSEAAIASAEANKTAVLAEQAALQGDLFLMTENGAVLAETTDLMEMRVCEEMICYMLQEPVPEEEATEEVTDEVAEEAIEKTADEEGALPKN